MKKVLIISFSVLFSFGLISCKKEKNCSCNHVVIASDPTGEWEGMLDNYNQNYTYSQTTTGECSDLSATGTSNMMGVQLTETVTCTEQ